jgi:hypothetical protein
MPHRLLAIAVFLGLILGFAVARPTARAEVIQKGGIRVSFAGDLTPTRLPRHATAPVRVSVAAKIVASAGGPPPQLRRIEIAINRHGRLDSTGLPVCRLRDIQPTTNADALAACGPSLVGEGRFSAQVDINGQAPYPSQGRLLAFNGTYEGSPAILAHVYGSRPVPTSYTLAFLIKPGKGAFGTVLEADLVEPTSSSDYVTGISLDLGRNFRDRGTEHSYLSASCPAPKGFPGAVFPFARATFGFAKTALVSTVTRSCRAAG